MGAWLRSHPWAMVGVGVVAGIVGFSFTWAIWHLYQDHLTHHQLVNVVNQLIQQIQQAQKAAGQPPALPGR